MIIACPSCGAANTAPQPAPPVETGTVRCTRCDTTYTVTITVLQRGRVI